MGFDAKPWSNDLDGLGYIHDLGNGFWGNPHFRKPPYVDFMLSFQYFFRGTVLYIL